MSTPILTRLQQATWSETVAVIDGVDRNRRQTMITDEMVERIAKTARAMEGRISESAKAIGEMWAKTQEGKPVADIVAAAVQAERDFPAPLSAALSVEQPTPQKHVKWPDFGSFGSATAMMDVIDERLRQQNAEGWSLEHDDAHSAGEMAAAAATYAYFGSWSDSDRQKMTRRAPQNWPWDLSWWKPTGRRRDLVKAAALLIAEIERLDRAALATEGKA